VQPNNTFDSICIGGDFLNIGSVAYRPLARLAYYSFYDADGTPQTLFSQSSNILSTSWGGTQYQVLGSFSPVNSGNYDSITCECAFEYVVNAPFQPPTATMVIELLNPAGAVISSSAPIGVLGLGNVYNLLLNPAVPLVGGFYYQIRANCTDFTTTAPFGLLSFGSDSNAPPVPYCIFTANLSNGYIGWRTLATDWTNPVGPKTAGSGNKIRGGGKFSTGALGFIFDGTDVSTSVGHLTTNYIFSVVYDAAELATFYAIGGDADTIDSTQSWGSGHTNSITGGNPVVALNELSYGELYCNRGYSNSQNVDGVYYRPSAVDPYEMTDCLIFAGISLTADQLKPVSASAAVAAVYRDDTIYPNIYWVARSASLETATISGGVPSYTPVTFTGGGAIPCESFGGYSNEIGYIGLILVCPTDVYLYKGSVAGELVIDLQNCVVRCANNIYAQNKLTFPANQDGTSITLVGDTTISPVYNTASWWAISQDGGIYYDNVLVNNNAGSGVTSAIAGGGIGVSSATGAVTISNTGATSIVAGSNITISSTGAGGTGAVTINAVVPSPAVTAGLMRITMADTYNIVNLNSDDQQYNYIDWTNVFANPSANILQTGVCLNNFSFNAINPMYITYTGTNPIAMTIQIPFQVQVSIVSGSTPVSLQITNPYQLSSFGLSAGVSTSAGNPSPYSNAGIDWCCGSNATYVIGGWSAYAYSGQAVFNVVMRNTDRLEINFWGNAIYNGGAALAGHQASGYYNAANSLPSGITFTCFECPAP
jgi:hypothetical protein